MTTATTPRHPAKRAKGRAQTLHADPYETVVGWQLFADEYEEAVERMARALMAYDVTDKEWLEDVHEAIREDFRVNARAALAAIGIAAPRKERKK